MTIALWQRPLARVVQGIVKAGNGCWLDPPDMSTLFQDAAGTIPVTAVEQPVGLILDKSGNGNHATQSVTASRPTLSARYNLLTKTEDFSGAVWIKTPSTTQSAKVLSISAGATSRVTQVVSGSGDFTITAVFSSADVGKRIRLGFWASGIDGISASGMSEDLVIPDSGIVSFTKTGLVSMTNIGIINSSDGVAKTVTLRDGFGVSLLPTSALFQYQRVNTATDYDTNPLFFPKYLRFDGVDDYLNLPYMGLYANGSATVVMSMARSKTGKIKYALTEGNPAGGKSYIPLRLSDSGITSRIVNDTGTTVILTPESAGAPNSILEVITFIDDGVNLKLLKNSQIVNNSNYVRAGTLTLSNLTIGAILQAAVTENMLANMYGLIITKSALTDAQRVRCERFLARKAGVML